jgi:hypothetical protein
MLSHFETYLSPAPGNVIDRHSAPHRLFLYVMGSVAVEKRLKGQRRWGLDTEFPLRDSDGLVVVTDRRRITDRRLGNTSLEERLIMFSGLPHRDPD